MSLSKDLLKQWVISVNRWCLASQVKDMNTCIAGFSQQCYSQPNCVAGSEIAILTDVPTPKDCCVGTNDGQSYGDSGGNCAIPQCVGKTSVLYNYFHKKSIVSRK